MIRRSLALAALMAAAIALVLAPGIAFAHAEPESANPAIGGTVDVMPAEIEVIFSQEVTEGTSLTLIGPDGQKVGDAAAVIDLNDPNRKRVTLAVPAGLMPGTYTVQWVTISGEDGDQADGDFTFTLTAPATPTAAPSPTPAPTPVPLNDAPFDAQGWGIAVLVGLAFAGLLFLFWRVVKPKNPKFG